VSETLAQALARLPIGAAHPCSYLPEQLAQQQYFYWFPEQGHMPGHFYQSLMDQHFRRSGRMFYRPRCAACTRCIPIRIALAEFAPSRSQRRALVKNADLSVRWAPPVLDEARLALYQRYAAERHGGEPPTAEATQEFLYDSPTDTIEASYWLGERLIGVGICDVTDVALSAVYFYFDPDETARSLGVFSALQEVAYARAHGLSFYYLGYWVPGCRKMEYKAAFADHELLREADWQPAPRDFSASKG
jgi:arginine-tRNA-protein transferase